MYRKHVKQAIGITLKHFFDLDETFISGANLTILALLSICKLYLTKLTALLTGSWKTVKTDASDIRITSIEYRQRWMNSETRENLLGTLRTIKNNVVGKLTPAGN
jgi:hypothetical protein